MGQQLDAAVRQVAESRYWREADARVMVEAWQRSGDSLAVFARRYRVDRKRITRWASRLTRSPRRGVRFHPVQVVATAAGGSGSRAAIEVVLADGRTVRVPPGFAPEDLQQVLRVLDGAAGC